MSEDQAYAHFVSVRFADNGGVPFCAWCGHLDVYSIPTRKKWKCAAKECRKQFSATSRTIFAHRKLPYQDILLAIAHFVNAAKGLSAIHLSLKICVSYKTAFVLQHKFREALATEQNRHSLRGKVEMDGAYFGGYVRPSNSRPLRIDRRRLPHRGAKRQCVFVMRERKGRTRVFVCSESEGSLKVPSVVERGSKIYADGGNQFNKLNAYYETFTVNHSVCYADGDNSTNWAESYFSRLRRAEIGTHHHVAGPYLSSYANECAWREDRRELSNQENYDEALRLTAQHPVSRDWKGYWQRRRAG